MKMETTAKLNNLRMSPRKLRLLIDLIRGMNVHDAMAQLQHSSKVAALPLRKLLASALANAKHNHNLDEDTLVVKAAFVDGGPIMYRWMPRAFGRATPLRKRTAHVTVTLEGETGEIKAPEKKSKKTEEQEENTKEEKAVKKTTKKVTKKATL